MVFAIIALGATVFFAHRWWVIKREQAAQSDFSALIHDFETMSRDKNPEWSSLLEKFEEQYAQHASSSLLPYYQSYKVQILLEQGDAQAALASLDNVISALGSSSYVPLYEMERALIQLSSADESVKATGLTALKILAENTKNIFHDSAQFYLGRYYWSTGDVNSARVVWQQLVDEQRDEKIAPSPWVSQVQEQLKLTIV